MVSPASPAGLVLRSRHPVRKSNADEMRVSQDLSGDTFRFARHLGAIRNDSVSCVGRSAMQLTGTNLTGLISCLRCRQKSSQDQLSCLKVNFLFTFHIESSRSSLVHP